MKGEGNDDADHLNHFTDEVPEDKYRAKSEQVGSAMLLSNFNLLQKAVESPQLGVEGTFSIVAPDSSVVEFELVTSVAKKRYVWRHLPYFRMIASQNNSRRSTNYVSDTVLNNGQTRTSESVNCDDMSKTDVSI